MEVPLDLEIRRVVEPKTDVEAMVAKKNKVTQEQRDNIIAISGQGVPKAEIARQMGLGVDQVSGVCSYAVQTGVLPPSTAPRRPRKGQRPPVGLTVEMSPVIVSDVPQYPQPEAP